MTGPGSRGAAADLPFAALPPDPVQWAGEPRARVSSEITMEAAELASPGGVEYSFKCTEGPGHDSGWRDSREYSDTGLEPATVYTYVARARDGRTKKEIAPPSRPASATTRGAKNAGKVKIELIDKALSSGELEIIPLMVTGEKDNRVNIVVVNRWTKGQRNGYNRPELRDEFIEDARHVVRAFTAGDEKAIAPYPTYRGFINIYAVWWPGIPPWNPEDRDNCMHWADYNEIRARFFLPWQAEGKGWVTHLAMFNGSGGGGGAGLREKERVGDAMIVGNRITSFIHEFNHTAPGIPDEYTSSGMWGSGRDGSTSTNDYRRETVKWRAWLDPETPVPTPYSKKYIDTLGVFEGGIHRMAFMYRPTARGCIMGAGSFAGTPKGMCLVCRQRAVQRLYRWVDAVEKTTPARKELVIEGPGKVRFAVERVRPEPDTQRTEWLLNGKVIAAGTDELDVAFGPLAEYELTFRLTDESAFIRPDPPNAAYPRAETRWKIVNRKPTSTAARIEFDVSGRDPVFRRGGRPASDGTIALSAKGGRPPYTYVWSDGASTPGREGLAAGRYEFRLVDSEFRYARGAVTIGGLDEIEPEVRSSLDKANQGGRWSLTVLPDDMKGVTCRWSDGKTGMARSGLADGTYGYTLAHGDGAEFSGSVTLVRPARPLSVEVAEVVPSSGGEMNGKVFLAVRGGRGPYAFAWSDGVGLAEGERHFMPPGEYAVTVRDANATAARKSVTVAGVPGFKVRGLASERGAPGWVRVSRPEPGLTYHWYAEDVPQHIPRYPNGIYEGRFTATDGRVSEAEAFVIMNKGGMYVDDRRTKNNLGSWIDLRAFTSGRKADPFKVTLNSARGGGKAGRRLEVRVSRKPGSPKGVKYEYYEGEWGALPDFDRLTPVKTGTVDYFGIGKRKRDDGFGFRFTGFVKIPKRGRHVFYTVSDDGSALFVGSRKVVDNDGIHGGERREGAIMLEAGMHPITVTFFEQGGGESLEVGYVPAGATPTAKRLAFRGQSGETAWRGMIEEGRLTVESEGVADVADAAGAEAGKFELLFAGRPLKADRPLHVGNAFTPGWAPPRPGNYFVAAQKTDSRAMSSDRVGVAVTIEPAPRARRSPDGTLAIVDPRPGVEYAWYGAAKGGAPAAKGPTFKPRGRARKWYVAARRDAAVPGRPLPPSKVKSAKLLMWLDASDVDGDGVEDASPPRRGSIIGWKGKAGGVDFKDFVYYQPGRQNGLGVASWKTIWLQSLNKDVRGYRTVFMVRCEHDLSSAGTAPWRGLSRHIGVHEDGSRMMSDKVDMSDEMRKGAVYLNGVKVDPFTTPMPEGFYLATYEFGSKVGDGIRRSDGHWEGAVAECAVYDGVLEEAERKGLEAYLSRKWLSAAHLESRRSRAE